MYLVPLRERTAQPYVARCGRGCSTPRPWPVPQRAIVSTFDWGLYTTTSTVAAECQVRFQRRCESAGKLAHRQRAASTRAPTLASGQNVSTRTGSSALQTPMTLLDHVGAVSPSP